MTAMTIDRRQLTILDRAAIRVGTTLVAWGRRRAFRRGETGAADDYRVAYAERVRTASALTRQQLLP